jgi:hypothetical protein
MLSIAYLASYIRNLGHKVEVIDASFERLNQEQLISRVCDARADLAGGPHCTAEPIVTVETNAFNGVIAGEADNVFIPSIECILEDNYNLPWLYTPLNKAAKYAFAEDLDILPFPAKKLFLQYKWL